METKLLTLADLADRLGAGFTAAALADRISKTARNKGRLQVAGVTIACHKEGNRWVLWSRELDQIDRIVGISKK